MTIVTMWSETDLDSEQFVSEHLLTGTNARPKENGDYHHHHSLDPVDPMMGPGGHNHLLRHEMLSDAMLGHVGEGGGGLHSLHARDRDQVKWAPHTSSHRLHRQSAAHCCPAPGHSAECYQAISDIPGPSAPITPPLHTPYLDNMTCQPAPDLTHVSTLHPVHSTCIVHLMTAMAMIDEICSRSDFGKNVLTGCLSG